MRDTFKSLTFAGGVSLLLAGPAAAMTVEQVISKHIDARGGAERWKAIESLEITGSQTAWSKKSPFTLQRKRGGKYHLDSTQDGKKVEVGYDGQTAWWDNYWMQEGAQRLRGPDLAVLMREVDFPTPFFDYREKGYEVKLVGDSEFEGRKAIGVEVKRADGLSETWYLDPATYLEIGRESPGSDFGRPVPLRTYYDDFRTVDGVKIPFRVESQWYTRERILNVEKIATNVAIDDAKFALPPPTGMAPLLPLVGEWEVSISQRNGPGAPWRDSERTSLIEPLLSGALLQERFKTGEGNEVVRSITFDRYKKRYRITEVNDRTTYMDVQEGTFEEGGKLSVNNTATNTTAEMFGMTIHGRMAISEITPDGFKLTEDFSTDGGKEWVEAVKATYTRVKK